MGVFCAVSGCFSTAYKCDNGISFHRFSFRQCYSTQPCELCMKLSFHSVDVTVFTVARRAGPLATH